MRLEIENEKDPHSLSRSFPGSLFPFPSSPPGPGQTVAVTTYRREEVDEENGMKRNG